jgi:hypothetical protein
VVNVPTGTPINTVDLEQEDLSVYAYGYPQEDEHVELLDSLV